MRGVKFSASEYAAAFGIGGLIVVGGYLTYAFEDLAANLIGRYETEVVDVQEVALTEQQISIKEIQQKALQQQWDQRVERTRNFRSQYVKNLENLRNQEEQREASLLNRKQNRSSCVRQIRQASRYTKFDTALDCYRGELALDLQQLRQEKDMIEAMVGVSQDIKLLTTTRLDLLADSLEIVITAMDSGVYENVAELEEAKANLLINYRQPYWLMVTRLQADKLKTWVAAISTRVANMKDLEGMPEDATELFLDGITCINEADSMLDDVIAQGDYTLAKTDLKRAQKMSRTCISKIRGANDIQVAHAAAVQEESGEQDDELIINRRLRRRLGEEYEVYDSRTELLE